MSATDVLDVVNRSCLSTYQFVCRLRGKAVNSTDNTFTTPVFVYVTASGSRLTAMKIRHISFQRCMPFQIEMGTNGVSDHVHSYVL